IGRVRPTVQLVEDAHVDRRGVNLGQICLFGVGVAPELFEPNAPSAHLLDRRGNRLPLRRGISYGARNEDTLFGEPFPDARRVGPASSGSCVDDHADTVRAGAKSSLPALVELL